MSASVGTGSVVSQSLKSSCNSPEPSGSRRSTTGPRFLCAPDASAALDDPPIAVLWEQPDAAECGRDRDFPWPAEEAPALPSPSLEVAVAHRERLDDFIFAAVTPNGTEPLVALRRFEEDTPTAARRRAEERWKREEDALASCELSVCTEAAGAAATFPVCSEPVPSIELTYTYKIMT
jgi:hypothetical protein